MKYNILILLTISFLFASCSDNGNTDKKAVQQSTPQIEGEMNNAKPSIQGQAANDLIYGFCYALQATSSCDELSVRLDTQPIIEAEVGQPFTESGDYHSFCVEGISQAIADESQGICREVWAEYGCYGSKIAGIIQNDPFTVKEGIRCQYK